MAHAFGHAREYAERTAEAVDAEVRRILDEQHERVRAVLTGRRAALERLGTVLLEREILEGDELRALLAASETTRSGRHGPPKAGPLSLNLQSLKLSPGDAMGGRKTMADQEIVERAEFVERTVKDLCELLRAGAPYPEISEQIERSREALQSIRIALWQRELVRTTRSDKRRAA